MQANFGEGLFNGNSNYNLGSWFISNRWNSSKNESPYKNLTFDGFHNNDEEVVESTKMPAEHGDVEAQGKLADMYYNGEGVEQDYQKSFEWFKKATEKGSLEAQAMLGTMYYKGKGVDVNLFEAYKHSKIASLNGDDNTISFAKMLEVLMTPAQIAEAQKLAEEWIEKHKN